MQAGLISEADLAAALVERDRTGERLGAVLVRLNLASDAQIARALGAQLGLPTVDLSERPPQRAALQMIDRRAAEEYVLVPMSAVDGVLTVAMSDPLQFGVVQDLERATRHTIRQVVATRSDILAAIQGGYDAAPELPGTPRQADASRAATASTTPDGDIDLLLRRLASDGASEIHIEPTPSGLTVRCRLDGRLVDAAALAGDARDRAIAAVKRAAGIDLSETRLAQEGRLALPGADGAARHFRVTTLRTVSGEKAVLRALERRTSAPPLDTLGMSSAALATFRQCLGRESGIVLVAGPSRSGTTTTLGSVALDLAARALSVVTIEDPVEYEMAGAMQVQPGEASGATAAAVVAAALNQQPDAIVIGEVSAADTVAALCRAAEGCLVVAGVRGDDSAAAMTALAGLAGRRLVAHLLACAVAQRLVRRLCVRCRRPSTSAGETLFSLNAADAESAAAFEAVGCEHCHHTGYRGRVGIFEVMRPTGSLRRLIEQGAPDEDLRAAALAGGMVTLAEGGVDKVKAGLTTVAELLRVMRELDEVRGLCRSCGAPVGIEFAACPGCGTSLSRPCRQCGRFVQPGWSFCPFCARRVDAGR